MAAAGTDETLVYTYQIMQCRITGNCNLNIHHCENLKLHMTDLLQCRHIFLTCVSDKESVNSTC
jgi:hypothetical protein